MLGEAAVVLDQMHADARVELGPAEREPTCAFDALDRAREGKRPAVDPVQVELCPKHPERVERDPAVRRQLAARDAEHPTGPSVEDRFAARGRRRAVPDREHPQARIGRANPFCAD